MNEGSGSMAYDSSGNANDATVYGAEWGYGKYENALNFTGATPYVKGISALSSLTTFTFTAWVKVNTLADFRGIVAVQPDGTYNSKGFRARITGDGRVWFLIGNVTYDTLQTDAGVITPGSWYHIAIVGDSGTFMKIYINGALNKSKVTTQTIAAPTIPYWIGQAGYAAVSNDIVLDDVRIYNRTLSAVEVAALYEQPNPAFFVKYYNYQDPITNNTMLIHIYSPEANSDNIAFVTCTSFFENNKLVFIANNTAVINVWTNREQPTFTTGIWNTENKTITLTLDASSGAEISWNPLTSPYSSKLSATSTNAGRNTTFCILWSDNQSLAGGGYIFSTNNTGKWINASWTDFGSNPCWGNVTLNLNSTIGVVVGFREYANNSLNLWGNSKIYTITTTSAPATPTPSPTLSPTSTPTSSPPPHTSSPSTEMILTAVIALLALVTVFVMALKKRYISIEIIEEKPEE